MANHKTRFGNFTIIDLNPNLVKGQKLYKCRCRCGNIRMVAMASLKINKHGCVKCYNNSKRKHKYGDKTHKLTFIKYCDKNKILVKCDCGKQKEVSASSWYVIKSCGCLAHNKGLKANTYCGTKYISGTHINKCVHRAKQGNKEFIVNKEDLDNLLKKQNFKCVLSGLPIISTTECVTASLDRIDSSRGYTKDNIQWVHKSINIAKNSLSQSDFIYLCHLVAENNTKPNSSIFDNNNINIKLSKDIIQKYIQNIIQD